ncbi:hypothetical protein GCK32_019767, partial [Trichostrongylus colubriformis]
EKNEVLRMKEEIRKEKREAQFGNMKCKEELTRVLDYIDSLHYHDHVDYTFIYKLLEEGAVTAGGNIHNPYDWETEPSKPTRKSGLYQA